MRQKTQKAVLTFDRTVDAMAMETMAREQAIPGRLIPIPTSISAGCGLCWMVMPEQQEQVQQAVEKQKMAHGSWHLVML